MQIIEYQNRPNCNCVEKYDWDGIQLVHDSRLDEGYSCGIIMAHMHCGKCGSKTKSIEHNAMIFINDDGSRRLICAPDKENYKWEKSNES